MSTSHIVSPLPGVCDRGRSISDLIGNTPLLRLSRCGPNNPHITLLAKAEWFNPGGSVKDRAAIRMLRRGEESGALRPGKTILEATSGNTGIALAMLGAAFGYPREALRARYRERRAQASAPGLRGGDRRDERPRRDRWRHPRGAPNRGLEPGGRISILTSTETMQIGRPITAGRRTRSGNRPTGEVTHFVCGLGTSGTFVGTTRRLKELKPSVRCISVEPDGPFHGIEGWKHMASSLVPRIYDPTLADERLSVSTEDAYETALRLAREDGLLVSVSGAAALTAALRVAEQPAGRRRGHRVSGQRHAFALRRTLSR